MCDDVLLAAVVSVVACPWNSRFVFFDTSQNPLMRTSKNEPTGDQQLTLEADVNEFDDLQCSTQEHESVAL